MYIFIKIMKIKYIFIKIITKLIIKMVKNEQLHAHIKKFVYV